MKISIIIPTLNEVNFLSTTLKRINSSSTDSSKVEVLVIDSGSSDETVNEAIKSRLCKIHQHPELKGEKYAILNQGVKYATGDIYLFLDADTLLPSGFDLSIKQTLSEGYDGGAFEFKLDGKKWGLRVIELANRLRYRLGQRYYGDQGVFCSKTAFEQAGGYPNKPILESAYFCSALKKNGKLKLIKQPIITSSRRFERSKLGPIWVLTVDTWIFLLDKFGFKNEKFGRYYWSVNDQR